MRDRSILKNFKQFLKSIHVFWLVLLVVMIGALVFSMYEINKDLKNNINYLQKLVNQNIGKFEDQFDYYKNQSIGDEIIKITKKEVVKVYFDGVVKKATNETLVGYSIKNSSVFKKITNLSAYDVSIMAYNGFISGKTMIYFTKKFENEFIIQIVKPNDFFVDDYIDNKLIFTDKRDIVLYSTDKELIGYKYNAQNIIFDGLKIYYVKKFKLNTVGNFDIYIQKNISAYSYIFISILLMFMVVFIFLTNKVKEIKSFIRTVEKEYFYFDSVISKISKEIKTSNDENFFIAADKYEDIFLSINEKLHSEKFKFTESKSFAKTVVNLNNLSRKLLKNLKSSARELTNLDRALEEKIKERTNELQEINEQLRETLSELQREH